MRVLITWGTNLGGTEGIARIIAEVLQRQGFEVTAEPAARITGDLRGYDAAVIGGALYANRWHRDARRFVDRHVGALRRIPVWFFSSGPLDDSADRAEIAPTTQVAVAMERIGACGHVTFGGRLAPDAKGFPAAQMAKKLAGDYRDPERVRAWATQLAQALPLARPGVGLDHPARSLSRAFGHGIAGWAVSAALMAGLLQVASVERAGALHAIAVPLIFAPIAVHYFRARGAREPLPIALFFTALVAVLDLVLAGAVVGVLLRLASTWVAPSLVFVSTWSVGVLVSTLPWPKPEHAAPARSAS